MGKGVKKLFALALATFLLLIITGLTGSDSQNSYYPVNKLQTSEPKAMEPVANAKTIVNESNPKTAVGAVTSSKKQVIKTAYITFDDGPSANVTPEILDVLKKYNVKVTFFVVGQMAQKNPEILKREQSDGHYIANHTYSHNYKYIYSSPVKFINDINKCNSVISSILGTSHIPKIVRFPGGSFGKKYLPFKQALKKAGYDYVDWNALCGDAEGHNVPVNKLVERIQKTTAKKDEVIILMHDTSTKKTTAEALPKIITYLKSQGYEFKTLDKATKLLSSR